MTELAPSLVELARRYGVATEYLDWKGQHVVVPETTLVAVLGALGVAAATEDDRAAALAAHDRDYWERSPAAHDRRPAGSASSFWVHVTHGDPVGLWIRLEDGSVRTGLRQLENNTCALRSRWPLGRRGHLRAPRRPPARLSRAACSSRLAERSASAKACRPVSTAELASPVANCNCPRAMRGSTPSGNRTRP